MASTVLNLLGKPNYIFLYNNFSNNLPMAGSSEIGL